MRMRRRLHSPFLGRRSWAEKVSQNRGSQRLLQPLPQTLCWRIMNTLKHIAGEAFLDLGIHRGDTARGSGAGGACGRAGDAAGALAFPPSHWRREQRRLALEDRDRIRADARRRGRRPR